MKNTIFNTFRLLLLCVGVALASGAYAIELDAAKSQGLVGERADGYLGAVREDPSAEVRQLVSEVNSKRKARYEEIAKKNSISLADVEARAGQRAMEKTPRGGWIFKVSWEQKQ